MSKKIVILCDWLPPDFGAVGQYALGFAEDLAVQGAEVTVVGLSSEKTSEENYSHGLGQVSIMRIYSPQYNRNAWLRRGLWTLSTNILLIKAAWLFIKEADEIRFTGSPPYMLHFIMPIAMLLNKKTRYRITDFHPECLIAAIGYTPFWLRPLKALSNFWRRRVTVVEVLGEDQRRRIKLCGVEPKNIELVRDPSPVQFSPEVIKATIPSSLEKRAIILYSGNWGVAHDLDTFVEGFTFFCQRYPDVAGLWLNAVGKRANLIQSLFEKRQLPHVRTQPVPLDQLPGVLIAADIHLITLSDAFIGYVLPSKVYACVQSGRSVLFIGSAESDVHLICSKALLPEKYQRVEVGDHSGVVEALLKLLAIKSIN